MSAKKIVDLYEAVIAALENRGSAGFEDGYPRTISTNVTAAVLTLACVASDDDGEQPTEKRPRARVRKRLKKRHLSK